MLGIGFGELVVIGVLALLFVPTDDLPRLAREFGRRYGQLRRAADDLRRAFVLEADRQDASERFEKLQERRRKAAEARKKPDPQAVAGTVVQEAAGSTASDNAPTVVPAVAAPSEAVATPAVPSIPDSDPEIPHPSAIAGREPS